jgi:L-arabinose transport system substrate-binding protein
MLNDWIVKGAEPVKYTEVADVVLLTRENFKVELKKKGL